MLSVTSLTTLFALDIIHLSAKVILASTDSLVTPFIISSSIFMNTNLDAFHNLFAKFLAASTLSMQNLISFPGEFPVANMNLNASAPYWSITSNGSIPFPKDLLIFLPSESLTSPCINTCLNGVSPIQNIPANAILTTQKNIISYPVTSTLVGQQ